MAPPSGALPPRNEPGDRAAAAGPRLPWSWPRVRRILVVALPLAAAGLLLFGLVHALLIVPIWRRLLGGVPFALLAALFMTLAFIDLTSTGKLPSRARGLVFGLAIWLSLFPVTAVGAWLRLSGLHRRAEWLEIPLEVAVAFATGGVLGWWLVRRRRSVLLLGACCVAVMLAMAGPIAVTNGRRPTLLFLAFLPIYLVAGVLLGALERAADRGLRAP